MNDVRRLDSPAAIARASALIDAIWGSGGLLPAALVRALDHDGGYAFGAYEGDELVGASVGFLGGRPDAVHLYSHVTGVVARRRGQGVGLALKHHQRAWSLERGIERVVWTFDPLVRRNAAFNITKLGARPVEYLVNFYGRLNDGINRGDESDRLLVEWDLRATLEAGEGTVTVAVPADIERLRADEPDEARRWRYEVRDALAPRLADGWRVVAFTDAGYVLRAPTS